MRSKIYSNKKYGQNVNNFRVVYVVKNVQEVFDKTLKHVSPHRSNDIQKAVKDYLSIGFISGVCLHPVHTTRGLRGRGCGRGKRDKLVVAFPPIQVK